MPVNPGVYNGGAPIRGLTSLPAPATTEMLTVDAAGNMSRQAIPIASFGALTGSPSDNAALQSALDAKLNLSGGTLTGTLTSPEYRSPRAGSLSHVNPQNNIVLYGGFTGYGIGFDGNGELGTIVNSTLRSRLGQHLGLGSAGQVRFNSSADTSGAWDTLILRNATGPTLETRSTNGLKVCNADGSDIAQLEAKSILFNSQVRDQYGIGFRAQSGYMTFYGFNTIGSNSPTMSVDTAGVRVVGKTIIGAANYSEAFGSEALKINGAITASGAVTVASFGSDPVVIRVGSEGDSAPSVNAFLGGYSANAGNVSTIYYGQNLYYNGSNWIHPYVAGRSSLFYQQNGAFYWNTHAGNAATGVGTERMSLNNSGTLAVNGTVNATNVRCQGGSGIVGTRYINNSNDTWSAFEFPANVSAATFSPGGGGGLFRFEGTTSAHVAWKRSSQTIQARLADDSGFASISCRDMVASGVVAQDVAAGGDVITSSVGGATKAKLVTNTGSGVTRLELWSSYLGTPSRNWYAEVGSSSGYGGFVSAPGGYMESANIDPGGFQYLSSVASSGYRQWQVVAGTRQKFNRGTTLEWYNADYRTDTNSSDLAVGRDSANTFGIYTDGTKASKGNLAVGAITANGSGGQVVNIVRSGFTNFGLGDKNGDSFRIYNNNTNTDLFVINATSRAIDCGAITASGVVEVPAGTSSAPGLKVGSSSQTGLHWSTNALNFVVNGAVRAWVDANSVMQMNAAQLQGSGSYIQFFGGAFLYSGVSNTLEQYNGGSLTSAQTYRLYNTRPSSTNFESLQSQWDTNEARIGTNVGSAGGAQRNLVLGHWNSAGTWARRLTCLPDGSNLTLTSDIVTLESIGGGSFVRYGFGSWYASNNAIHLGSSGSRWGTLFSSAINTTGNVTLADASNLILGTTTGTKIGTATTQKIGFFNATPVVQPSAVADATDAASVITQLNALLSRMRDLGLIAA